MNSLDPRDFAALPALEAPAAYVCVIRDIDRDRYRIEATHSPQALVDAVVAETKRNFGIELVAVLRTQDLAASEAELYARHHARLSGEWLALDAHQLEELQGSALQIDAFASHYLTPQRAPYAKQETRSQQISRYQRLASSYLRGTSEAEGIRRAYSRPATSPNRGQWKRRRSRQPIPERRYGASSLRRNRVLSRPRGKERLSIREKASELVEDLFVNHPGIVICVLLILMLILLLHFGPMSRHYY